MTADAQDHDLTSRPIWAGLMGADDEGAYLVGGKCEACGFTTLGLRDICPDCWTEGSMQQTPIGRRGILYTYTVIDQLPEGYDHPFAVGYVDLADGVRVFAHLENTPESLVIGNELELTEGALRRDETGAELCGPRYRAPAEGGSS